MPTTKGVRSVSGLRWNDDDTLLAALGDAMRAAEVVPSGFVRSGQAAFAWHNIDAELAALAYDSATDTRELAGAGMRTEQASLRALTFASPRLSIHLEVTREALHGQIVPEQSGEIEFRPVAGASRMIAVDEVGWFVVQPVPAGSFRLRCLAADGTAVITDWITL
jgi:hypothetical protein